LAIELSQDNIGVSVICPSFFKTNLEESLRTDDDEIRVMMSKLFKHAKLTAPDVAEACWKAVHKGQFHVIPLYQDRLIFNLKRVLPFKQYAEMMIKRTVARVKKK
jgi:short-subunit dehydrogenase